MSKPQLCTHPWCFSSVRASTAAITGAAVALILGVAAAPGQAAQLGAVELKSQADVRFSVPGGLVDSLGSGFGLKGVGDVDGDGRSDVAVLPFASPPFNGTFVLSAVDLERNTRLRAKSGFLTILRGEVVGPAGDANGDGIGDLVAVGQSADSSAKIVGVVFGRRGGPRRTVDISNPGSEGFRIDAPGGDSVADVNGGVASVGDVNRDGRDDLLISAVLAEGRDYAVVIFGRRGSGVVSLESPGSGGYRINGICGRYYEAGDGGSYEYGPLGVEVSAVGDVDGDRRADLLFGTGRQGDEICGARKGEARVVYGKSGAAPVDYESARGLRFTGPSGTGSAVAGGDVSGDGRPDVLVSTKRGFIAITRLRGIRSANILRLGGRATSFLSGYEELPPSLVVLGDVNRDGLNDIGFSDRVVRSRRGNASRRLDRPGNGVYQALLADSGNDGYLVDPLEPAGDLNGDGRADFLGTPGENGPPVGYAVFADAPPRVTVLPFRGRVATTQGGWLGVGLLCPASTVKTCQGLVALTNEGRNVFRRRFDLRAGEKGRVRVRLPRWFRRRLANGVAARTTATATARDGRRARAVTRRTVVIQRGDRPR